MTKKVSSDYEPRPGMRGGNQKTFARGYTTGKVRRGEIAAGPCEVCGSKPAEWHHIDYADPDRVMRLCKRCHGAYHSQFGRPAPVDWIADIRAAQRRIDALRRACRGRPPNQG